MLMSITASTLAQTRLDLGLRRQLREYSASACAAAKSGMTQRAETPASQTQGGGTISFMGVLNEGAALPADELKAMGVTVTDRIGRVVFLRCPVSALEQIDQVEAFLGFESPSKPKPACKTVRQTTGVSLIDSNSGARSLGLPSALNGEGVIVGVYDTGTQFSHPNFRDQTTGTSRIIAAITSQKDPQDSGNQIYRVYRTADEIATLTPLDRTSSHGTHVAGIAAGSYTEQGLHGMAPKANLILGEDPNLLYGRGIKDMFAIADSLKKPLVINLSIVNDLGWCDGKTANNLIMQELTENGKKPGRIICVCAGNEADAQSGLHYTFDKAGEYLYTFMDAADTDDSGNTIYFDDEVNIYSDTSDSLGVLELKAYDTSTKQFVDTETLTATVDTDDGRKSLPIGDLVVCDTETSAVHDNRWHACIDITGTITINRPHTVLGFYLAASKPLTISMKYLNSKGLANLVSEDVEHGQDGSDVESINDDACTEACISVGVYSDRDSVMALDKTEAKPIDKKDEVGYWSGYGTTLSGVNKPDLVAPGELIISSANRHNTTYFSDDGTIISYYEAGKYPLTHEVVVTTDGQQTKEYWAAETGTSMATPVVTGVVALMLQVNPLLTTDDVRRILTETAITDTYTDNAGIQAGAGKLNAKAAVLEAYRASTGIADITVSRFSDVPTVEKRLINGRICIIKGGKTYTADGSRIM